MARQKKEKERQISLFSWKIIERSALALEMMTENYCFGPVVQFFETLLFFVCKYGALYVCVCKQWLVKLTLKLPASRQEHEAGNCFWDSQSEKALGKQEESVTVVLSGVSHPHNDLPTCLSESVIHPVIPSSKTAWLGLLNSQLSRRTSSTLPQFISNYTGINMSEASVNKLLVLSDDEKNTSN